VELLPALTYKTRVGQVRHLPAGWHIGYGTNQWVEEPVTTATLPVGHGDGLASSMAGKLDFLVNQKRCRLLAVCADNCMIDISGALPVSTGDEVVIVGRQGNDAIMAREIIDKSDTGYGEFFGKISLRTPRIYMMGGQQVGEMSFVACTGIARRGR
jgi:alanine racemase